MPKRREEQAKETTTSIENEVDEETTQQRTETNNEEQTELNRDETEIPSYLDKYVLNWKFWLKAEVFPHWQQETAERNHSIMTGGVRVTQTPSEWRSIP